MNINAVEYKKLHIHKAVEEKFNVSSGSVDGELLYRQARVDVFLTDRS